VGSSGDVTIVSAMGAKGTSYMKLSSGKGVGPDGAHRLADLLRKAPQPLLVELVLRCLQRFSPSPPPTHTVSSFTIQWEDKLKPGTSGPSYPYSMSLDTVCNDVGGGGVASVSSGSSGRFIITRFNNCIFYMKDRSFAGGIQPTQGGAHLRLHE
jgi:hypothetical protein